MTCKNYSDKAHKYMFSFPKKKMYISICETIPSSRNMYNFRRIKDPSMTFY